MSVELPKDHEGREIPLDVDSLYDKNGSRVEVFRWSFVRGRKCKWTFNLLYEYPDVPHYPQYYYLTPPDSWAKLEDDLERCIEDDGLCSYYSPSGKCSECILDGEGPCHGDSYALKDLKERIRKLRGDGE